MLTIILLSAAVVTLAAPDPIPPSCISEAYAPFPNSSRYLPDPWKFYNGNTVRTLSDFACRQQEWSAILQQFELGDLPPPPEKLTASLNSSGVLTLTITTNNRTITVVPANITSTSSTSVPGPAVISLSGATNVRGGGFSLTVPDTIGKIAFANDRCADQAGTSSRGRGWFYDLHGSSHSAGSLIAWAWCISRVIDGLSLIDPKQTGVDVTRLGVTGCSRNGKGAFVAGAFDKRIALTIPQESGGGGAACWKVMQDQRSDCRLNCDWDSPQTPWGIAESNSWFSRRFNEYARSGVGNMLSDHHFLAGLVAPRGLFVVENNIDWLSPVATTACMRAGRVIYDGLGVKRNMAFSMVGGHNHCQFSNKSEADLNSFYERFLLGTREEANDVDVSAARLSGWNYTGNWVQTPDLKGSGV
ncbi:4-O-methyl-glucuronoyl methylesterase [Cladorrhinum sp. PSN332]|nr:4-O-methyl-glucuronoyl methylesterase [Cladorrhinum sp. PSN332]